MKINKFTKTIASLFLGAFIAAGFTGCMNPIFHYIKEEVKLEEMKIHGDIYSFARIGEDSNAKIFVSNGKIYWKEASKEGYGGWTEFKKPEGQVYTIASDKNDNLYAVTFISSKYDSDGEMKVTEKRLYACSAAESFFGFSLPERLYPVPRILMKASRCPGMTELVPIKA